MAGSYGENIVIDYNQEEIQKAIDHETARLSSPEIVAVNDLFDSLMASSGKDVEWYRPFGVNSIRDMAIHLGDEAMYKVFYTQYSQVTHGLSIDQQLHFNPPHGVVIFDHIRTPQSIDQIYRMTFNFAFKIYRTVLERFRPSEIAAFNRKYLEEWRRSFMSIPKVKKEGGTITVTPPQSKT